MRAGNNRNAERLTEHTVQLQHPRVGQRVFIQNQTGNHPQRCERTGLLVPDVNEPEVMARAELLSKIGNFYGSSTKALWTAYLVLPAPSSL